MMFGEMMFLWMRKIKNDILQSFAIMNSAVGGILVVKHFHTFFQLFINIPSYPAYLLAGSRKIQVSIELNFIKNIFLAMSKFTSENFFYATHKNLIFFSLRRVCTHRVFLRHPLKHSLSRSFSLSLLPHIL